jgi:hypothetical protein
MKRCNNVGYVQAAPKQHSTLADLLTFQINHDKIRYANQQLCETRLSVRIPLKTGNALFRDQPFITFYAVNTSQVVGINTQPTYGCGFVSRVKFINSTLTCKE